MLYYYIKYMMDIDYKNFMRIINKYNYNIAYLEEILNNDGIEILKKLVPVFNLDNYEVINEMEKNVVQEAAR